MMEVRKSGLLRTIPLLITILSLCFPAYAKYSGGNGEPNDPYQIATAEDLMLLGDSIEDYDKHFILVADIDLDPNLPGRKVFYRAVIAPDTDPTEGSHRGTAFTGAFDSNGHIISHMKVRGKNYLGLFGLISGARISNLGLKDVNVKGTGNYIGGLAGRNKGSIITSYSTGIVSGQRDVGGLVGTNSSSIVSSYSTGTVSGDDYVGGLVGSNYGSIITSYSTSTVGGDRFVGGLVASNSSGNITTSYSIGIVSGNRDVGGLVGDNQYGRITASFWDIETSDQATSAGGMGLTTAEMQDIDIFLTEGWDFVNEIGNGTCDYWQISPGDYPNLYNHTGESPVMQEGLGTAEEPYLIRDARDLGSVWLEPSAHYRLEASLDLSEITWSMAVVPRFEGTFDGNSYVISNLHIQGGGYLGLFGLLVSGTKISNLGLEAVDVNGTGNYVGGISGSNGGIIDTSYSTGMVSGYRDVGGLVGSNGGNITTSYSTCTVRGEQYVGGLMGHNRGSDLFMIVGIIANCYSTGMVSGYRDVGGFVGRNGSSITMSYSTGKVRGNENVGGLVGENLYGRVAASFWDIETSGQSISAGGTGLSTAEMKDPEMLGLNGLADNPNWILNAYRDYPHLVWEGTVGNMISWPVMYWLEGNGTIGSPYQIATIDQLIRISRAGALIDRYFILVNNLDLSGLSWSQAVIPYFTGCFDGNGFILHNLYLKGRNNLGLTGCLEVGAIITNIGLEDVSIEGIENVGSLTGRNYGSISNSYSTGTITGEKDVGGLVGNNGAWDSDCGRINRCYSTATVSGDKFVGGLVGFNFGNVSRCYSTGMVSGNYYAGGFVGASTEIATICFWDIETSGQTISEGSTGQTTGQTTAEMQTASTYLDAGWDFVDETENGTEDIWWIIEGQDYPRLWWEAPFK